MLKSLQEKFDKRENALKKDLRKRALSAWEGPLFPYKEEEAAEQANESKTETEQLTFFTSEAPPPTLGNANLYRNIPDGFPDYVAISLPGERRPFFQRVDSDKETWVKENLGNFYKSIRNKHVQRYANQYKELLLRPYKSGARVEGSFVKRDPLCQIERNEALPQEEAKGTRHEGRGLQMIQKRIKVKIRKMPILFTVE